MKDARRDMRGPSGALVPSPLSQPAIRWTRRLLPPGAATALLAWLGLSGVGGVMRAAGVLLLGLAGALAGGLAACRRYTNWQVQSAEPELVGRLPWVESAAATLFVGAAAALAVGHSLVAGLVGAVAVIVWLTTEGAIVLRTRGRGVPRLSRRFTTGTPVGKLAHGIRLTIRTWPFEPLCLFLDRIASSKRNRVSGFVVLVSLIGGGGSASALGFTIMDEITGSREAPRASTSDTGAAKPNSPAEPPQDYEFDAAEVPLTFSSVCTQLPHVLPGDGAPDWAIAQLYDLYFKPGSGVGALVAGCPQAPLVITDEFDTVVYQLGFLPEGELRSVALATMSHGSAIVLGEPAAAVRVLLEEDASVGGSPRLDVANGDLQLVYTIDGTTTFIRSTKVKLSRSSAYVQLGPAETDAWLAAMARTGVWLWPEPLEGAMGLLARPGDNVPVAFVSRDGSGSRAVLRIDDTTVHFSSRGVIVSIDDLLALGMP